MGELVVPKAHEYPGPASHAGVYGMMAHKLAQGRVVRVRRLTPYDVAGVHVLEVDLRALLFEMLPDAVAEEDPDIAVSDIARDVPLARRGEELLAGALGDDDDGVPSPLDALLQGGEKTVKREGGLRYKAEVHLAVHQRGE